MENVDYLIVGSGFAGATFARQMTEAGKKCLVVEKRNHIGGNAYSERQHGIDVHLYGPHLFHTNSPIVWDWVTNFGDFNNYHHIVRANVDGYIYPMPINLMTMHQLWDVSTPEAARAMVACQTTLDKGVSSVEGWCLANIGLELYAELIEGYTAKQWGRPCSELPASIIKRLPVRYTYQEGYFTDKYQGVPVDGYGKLFENILADIPVYTEVNYLEDWYEFTETYPNAKVVYTGPIDELFDCDEGHLEYRSLEFVHVHNEYDDHQGIGQMNYPSPDVAYTRIIEHLHFNPLPEREGTVVTYEYPQEYRPGLDPYYPIASEGNNKLAVAYQERAKALGIIPLGRLGTYKYMNMDQTIAQAMVVADKELHNVE